MAGNKSPKTIATINFKGGVGKTTVTWCLADTLATYSNASVLMFDLDAQMSLTQAVEVQKLLEECADLKRTLKTISSQLARIETRVKAAFPAVAKKVKDRQIANASQKESSLSSEQALAEFDNIVNLASSGATSDAEAYVVRKSSADLLAIAKEVGVTFAHLQQRL